MKIANVVILYNVNPEKSATLQFLAHESLRFDMGYYIWDNSPEIQYEKSSLMDTIQSTDKYYIHNSNNISLAIIYNNSIRLFQNYDAIVFWDQDSNPSPLYFDNLKIGISNNPDIDLFLPKIYCDDKLVSPAKLGIVRGKLLKNLNSGLISANGMCAITSGMCIKLSFFKVSGFQFNEELKLYGIDTDFSISYRKLRHFYFLIDIVIKHDLYELSNGRDEVEVRKRFKNKMDAIKITYKNHAVNKFILYIYKLYLRLRGLY